MRPEGELWRIRAQAGLSVVTIVTVDIFFHFFYILTIPSDLKFANRLPDSALGGSSCRDGAGDALCTLGVAHSTSERRGHFFLPHPGRDVHCVRGLGLCAQEPTHFTGMWGFTEDGASMGYMGSPGGRKASRRGHGEALWGPRW